eukprot:SM000060S19620  [mRNA]  locus=s60:95824:98108:- [translate_table: standard]
MGDSTPPRKRARRDAGHAPAAGAADASSALITSSARKRKVAETTIVMRTRAACVKLAKPSGPMLAKCRGADDGSADEARRDLNLTFEPKAESVEAAGLPLLRGDRAASKQGDAGVGGSSGGEVGNGAPHGSDSQDRVQTRSSKFLETIFSPVFHLFKGGTGAGGSTGSRTSSVDQAEVPGGGGRPPHHVRSTATSRAADAEEAEVGASSLGQLVEDAAQPCPAAEPAQSGPGPSSAGAPVAKEAQPTASEVSATAADDEAVELPPPTPPPPPPPPRLPLPTSTPAPGAVLLRLASMGASKMPAEDYRTAATAAAAAASKESEVMSPKAKRGKVEHESSTVVAAAAAAEATVGLPAVHGASAAAPERVEVRVHDASGGGGAHIQEIMVSTSGGNSRGSVGGVGGGAAGGAEVAPAAAVGGCVADAPSAAAQADAAQPSRHTRARP